MDICEELELLTNIRLAIKPLVIKYSCQVYEEAPNREIRMVIPTERMDALEAAYIAWVQDQE